MPEPLSFRTKTGRCEITDDAICLVRTGFRGWLAELIYGNLAPSRIAREDIIRVEAYRPVSGATRGYFWIHYLEGSDPKKRIVILPGVLSGGGAEFEKAVECLASAGLLE